ncbi:MAG: hypothetical protein KKH98_05450 [Spirochaetes bacterium]|nr:hypothetical protein [Spirochaetota bacterium]
MEKNRTDHLIWLLPVFGILTAVLWRAEIELHGWEGLTWITYYHWAVPAGILLMAGWILICSRFFQIEKSSFLRSILRFGGYGLLGYLLFILTSWLLYFLFARGPSVFIDMMSLFTFLKRSGIPEYFFKAKNLPFIFYIAWLLWYAHPFFLYLILKAAGFKTAISNLIISETLFIASGPLAILLLKIISHKGGTDHIHAFKSGFIIPFLFISIGILFYKPLHLIRNGH